MKWAGWVIGLILMIVAPMQWQKARERAFQTRQVLIKQIKQAEEDLNRIALENRDALPGLERRYIEEVTEVKKLEARKKELEVQKQAYEQTMTVLSTGTGDLQKQADATVEQQETVKKELAEIERMLGLVQDQIGQLRAAIRTVAKTGE